MPPRLQAPMLTAISNRLQALHPDHLRIARAAAWVFLFTFLAKLAAAAREVAIAWRFGRGPEVDAYNLALTLSTWLPFALVSVLTVVLVPVLVRMSEAAPRERKRFLREVNGAALGVGAILTLAVWLAAPWLAAHFAAGLPAVARALTRDMLQTFAPLALLTVAAGVYAARLQARHDHRYSLAEGLVPFAVVVLVLIGQQAGPGALVAGTLVGAVLQTVWLVRLGDRVHGGFVGLAWPARTAQWRALWASALTMGAGQFAMSFAHPLDQYFAASLGAGNVAALGYASRLIGLGMALGAAVISRATLPIFSEGVARGELARIRRQAIKWTALMLVAGVIGTTIVWLFAPWLVALLFERGAFERDDTRVVAEALRWGIWQLPFYLAGLVLVSFLASARRYRAIALIGVANIGLKAAATAALARWLGLSGILFATALMYGFSMALCFMATRYVARREA